MNNKNFLRSHWHWHYDPPRLDNLFVVWLTAQKKREKKREREVFKERSTRFGGRAATTPGQCVPGGVLSVSLPPSPRCAWNRPAESKAGCITKPQKQAAAAEGERERGERLEVRREKMMNPRRKEKKKKKTPFFFLPARFNPHSSFLILFVSSSSFFFLSLLSFVRPSVGQLRAHTDWRVRLRRRRRRKQVAGGDKGEEEENNRWTRRNTEWEHSVTTRFFLFYKSNECQPPIAKRFEQLGGRIGNSN